MAYGLNSDEFQLKEGVIEIGTWDVTAITDTDPFAGWTKTADVGYFQQGSFNASLARQYAEFLASTPGQLIRKDLIRKQFMVTMQQAQFNNDLFALAQGLDVEGSASYTLGYIGDDEPTQPFNGYRLVTERVDGTGLWVCVFSAKNTAEEVGIALSGTAHATYEFKLEAFVDSAATTRTKNLGMFVINESTA